MAISPASRPGWNVSSTERLAVCLPLLVLAGPPTLAPGDARGQAPLPPRLSVDPALSPPSGVTRDGRAGLVAYWLESHTVRFRKARAARGGRCNPAVWLRAQDHLHRSLTGPRQCYIRVAAVPRGRLHPRWA